MEPEKLGRSAPEGTFSASVVKWICFLFLLIYG